MIPENLVLPYYGTPIKDNIFNNGKLSFKGANFDVFWGTLTTDFFPLQI